MNPIKENQKIKIIPDNVEKFSVGTIVSASQDCFIAEINNPSMVMAGLEPEILISSDDYMVMFTSKVNKIERNKVFFSVPPKFNYIQKREYPRINIQLPVLLQITDNPEEKIKAEIINIGGGGMQIMYCGEYEGLFKPNILINAEFNLTNNKHINVVFEVLRINEENNKIFLSGKFKTISNFDKTTIIQFCFKRQLEAKCKI